LPVDGSQVFEDAKLLRSELRLVMGSIAKDAGNDAGSKATRSLATATMAAPVLGAYMSSVLHCLCRV